MYGGIVMYSETEKIKKILDVLIPKEKQRDVQTANLIDEILYTTKNLEYRLANLTNFPIRKESKYTTTEINRVYYLLEQGVSMSKIAVQVSKEFNKSFSKSTISNIKHGICKPRVDVKHEQNFRNQYQPYEKRNISDNLVELAHGDNSPPKILFEMPKEEQSKVFEIIRNENNIPDDTDILIYGLLTKEAIEKQRKSTEKKRIVKPDSYIKEVE